MLNRTPINIGNEYYKLKQFNFEDILNILKM